MTKAKPKTTARGGAKGSRTKHSVVERVFDGLAYSAPATARFVPGVNRWGFPVKELSRAELAIAVQLAEHAPIGGEAFAWMRKALGLSGRDLGDLLGVRFETISRWERGEVEVTRAAWLWLCGALLEHVGKKPRLLERAQPPATK